MNLDVRGAVTDILSAANEHMPEVLTGTGIGLMVAGVALAVVATVKAVKKVEAEDDVIYWEDESKDKELPNDDKVIREHYESKHPDENVDVMDITDIIDSGKYKRRHRWKKIFKKVWKCYIPVVLAVIVGIVCLVASTREGLRRTAALATAYQLSDAAFTEYRNKVTDTIGEKKEQDIHTELAKDKAKEAAEPFKENPETGVIHTGDGETLMLDYICGRYFRSDIEFVKRQINILNHDMNKSGVNSFCSLNTLYEALNLPTTGIGEKIGWRADRGLIDIRETSVLHPVTNEPAYVLGFYTPPKYGFEDNSRYYN